MKSFLGAEDLSLKAFIG